MTEDNVVALNVPKADAALVEKVRTLLSDVQNGRVLVTVTPGNPGRMLANGSVVGFSEYSLRLRAEPEPPMQWAGLIQERWGLRERVPVVLS